MSLRPIRQYFRDRISELDRDFIEHTDAFNTENVGELGFDKAFHIFYGNISTTSINMNTTNDNVQAVVTLFRSGYRDPIETLDDAMDFANQFRLKCLMPKHATRNQFIKNVSCQSIKADPVNTNDNSIVISLQFNISVIFGTNISLDF